MAVPKNLFSNKQKLSSFKRRCAAQAVMRQRTSRAKQNYSFARNNIWIKMPYLFSTQDDSFQCILRYCHVRHDTTKSRKTPDVPFTPRVWTSWQSLRVQKEMLEEALVTCQMKQRWSDQNIFLLIYQGHPEESAPAHWHHTATLENRSSLLLERYFSDTEIHLSFPGKLRRPKIC